MSLLEQVLNILISECILLFISLCEIKCETEERLDGSVVEDDVYVRIYKPDERIFTVPDFNNWENNSRFSSDLPLWIFLGFAIFILFFFCCCLCLFLALAKKRSAISNRHPSSATLVHPPPTTGESNLRPHPANAHGLQINVFAPTNYAFEQDNGAVPGDMPPDYSAVILPTPPVSDSTVSRPRYPRVMNPKKMETPPPTYLTVAPFQ